MAQVEAGKTAVEFRDHAQLLHFIDEHTEAAGRYGLLLDYVIALKDGQVEAKLLVNATPEELVT